MLLTIDIGNTNSTCGLFSGMKLKKTFCFESFPRASEREYAMRIRRAIEGAGSSLRDVEGVSLASVVPELTLIFRRVCKRHFDVSFLEAGIHIHTGVTVAIDKPGELGADRLVNAIAAGNRFSGSVIVIDFGTATTFDCIRQGNIYTGGVIIPGSALSAQALAEHTARLPLVKVRKPSHAIGRNTVACIESGLFHGYRGMIREIIIRLKKEMPTGTIIAATGGYSFFWVKHLPEIKYHVPYLTLEGLALVWRLNKGDTSVLTSWRGCPQ